MREIRDIFHNRGVGEGRGGGRRQQTVTAKNQPPEPEQTPYKSIELQNEDYDDDIKTLTYIYQKKSFHIHSKERKNACIEIAESILCELIWRSNLLQTLTTIEVNALLSWTNINKLAFYVIKLYEKKQIQPLFSDDDFVFVSNHHIDLKNITRSAEGIVLRKIVSLQEHSLDRRLASACCVVFVRGDYCDKCNEAINILENAIDGKDRVVVVDINTLEEHIQETLYSYSKSPPIIFIGQNHIIYEKLKGSNTKDLQAMLATCRGKRWQ